MENLNFNRMTREEAKDKYIQVIFEWQLPPLGKEEFDEYISSQMNGYFYTPPSWIGKIKNKPLNWEITMDLTLDQLNKDKAQLNADILKVIQDFQNKYNVGINSVELIETRTMVQKFHQVVGINVEIRL